MRPCSLHTLKQMEKHINLMTHGVQLWGKDKARPIRNLFNQALEMLRPGDVLTVDHAGVEAFDITFATELFGKLMGILVSEHAGKFIVVQNLNDCTRENLSVALERLNLIIIVREKRELSLLGKVNPSDIETLAECIAAGGVVSTAVMSTRLGTTLTAMNERLAKLTAMGVLRRERGSSASGRTQYEYRLLN
jgi:hypothetical protein